MKRGDVYRDTRVVETSDIEPTSIINDKVVFGWSVVSNNVRRCMEEYGLRVAVLQQHYDIVAVQYTDGSKENFIIIRS